MRKVRVLSADEAVMLIGDGDIVATNGFVGSSNAEALTGALEKRFLETGSPKNLTLFHAAGLGNRDGRGSDHFAHEGMTRRVIAGHYNMSPNLGQLIIDNKIEGYNFPQGVLSQLYRAVAGKKVGVFSHVGLNTYVDPRLDGGKLNERTKEDLVELMEISGREVLFYKAFPIQVCFIRGTYADERGNISFQKEVTHGDATACAQAVRNSGGKVIVQVEQVVKADTLDPKLVKLPGIYVDAVVVAKPEEHEQCFGKAYDPSLTGEVKAISGSVKKVPLTAKKVIGRRAAMELREDTVVNLGIGAPEYVSMVANEEGIGDYMTLTVESGPVGGIPMGGSQFGSAVNADCYLDQGVQFDFYDGGGIDLAFLGLAQSDKAGNVNVSKFGPRIAGCGGFINITQNAKKVFFCGTFTAGGLNTKIQDGKLVIEQEGREKKFIDSVEHITFSGEYAVKTNQPVLYITERAVFELRKDGMYLTEVAPGIDVQTQILDMMGFEAKIAADLKTMDERIFRDEPMGL